VAPLIESRCPRLPAPRLCKSLRSTRCLKSGLQEGWACGVFCGQSKVFGESDGIRSFMYYDRLPEVAYSRWQTCAAQRSYLVKKAAGVCGCCAVGHADAAKIVPVCYVCWA